MIEKYSLLKAVNVLKYYSEKKKKQYETLRAGLL
jgi:hypothetical protein